MTQWGMDNNDLGVEQDGGVQVLDFPLVPQRTKMVVSSHLALGMGSTLQYVCLTIALAHALQLYPSRK